VPASALPGESKIADAPVWLLFLGGFGPSVLLLLLRGFFILHTGRGASCSNLPPSSSFVAPSPPLPLVKTRGGTLRLNSAQPLQGASAVRGPLRFFFFLLIPGQALRSVHLRQSQCSPQTARDRPGPMKGDAWGWVTSCVCGETPPRPWREG